MVLNEIQSPICCLLGNKGSGKTLFLTFLAYNAYLAKRKIYSNYKLIGIPYEELTKELLLNLPEELNGAVLLMDEVQMIADAYEFMSNQSKAITTLATQLRKRGIDLYIATQRLNFIPKRLRQLTDIIITFENIYDVMQGKLLKGHSKVAIYENQVGSDRNKPAYRFDIDLSEFFGLYDTNQVIS